MFTKQDYVTLDVAKKLKQKGFNEPCLEMINIETKLAINCKYDNGCVENNLLKEGYVSYPTLYEVKKWLRTKYKIFINVCFKIDFYNFYISYVNEKRKIVDIKYDDIKCSSYEDAENKAILESLELIQKLI